jgi:1,2-diacylglycerol 3-beta-glucosyltransferase
VHIAPAGRACASPRLWASRRVSKIGALEATYYLLEPWPQLAGSIVYPFPLAVFLANYLRNPSAMTAWLAQGWLMLFVLYFVIGLGPYLAWGAVYRCCERQAGVIGAIGLGFGYSLYVFTFYVTSWRVFCRIVRRRREWFKTRRNAEFLSDIGVHRPPAPAGGIQVIREIAGGNS